MVLTLTFCVGGHPFSSSISHVVLHISSNKVDFYLNSCHDFLCVDHKSENFVLHDSCISTFVHEVVFFFAYQYVDWVVICYEGVGRLSKCVPFDYDLAVSTCFQIDLLMILCLLFNVKSNVPSHMCFLSS
jgi:hypothetical protein